ncbi:MAG: DegT/DnrJ/EryC1/StrS family aminotransferase [Theionarchaea archaeon]|nr:DegT/DnrJ/EryC1/StrS family aminotransferase [Theionarchaea archaeon]
MHEIPLVDLARQYQSIKHEIDTVIQRVLEKGIFVLGENVQKFEEEFSRYCGVRYGIGVNSATDALTIALKAVGVKEGDEVLVPANSFIATANVVVFCGATPVFVDVEPDTLNMDPEKAVRAITKKTKAIIPVHLHGHPADMDPLLEAAEDHDLAVIEDVAQAINALYKGKKVGSLGDIGCFSFYPSKNLGAYGDGGLNITDNDELAERIRLLRNYGRIEKEYKQTYVHRLIGYNSRLDELQAAILRLKLTYLDGWTDRKREISKEYTKGFEGSDVEAPTEKEYARHVYWDYCIKVKARDALEKALLDKGIHTAVLYRVPIHLQEAYAYMGLKEGSFPVAEMTCRHILSLPLFPELTEEEIQFVITQVKNMVGGLP